MIANQMFKIFTIAVIFHLSNSLKVGKFVSMPQKFKMKECLRATIEKYHEIDQEEYDILERSLKRLRQERDKRKNDLLAAEMAVRQVRDTI